MQQTECFMMNLKVKLNLRENLLVKIQNINLCSIIQKCIIKINLFRSRWQRKCDEWIYHTGRTGTGSCRSGNSNRKRNAFDGFESTVVPVASWQRGIGPSPTRAIGTHSLRGGTIARWTLSETWAGGIPNGTRPWFLETDALLLGLREVSTNFFCKKN